MNKDYVNELKQILNNVKTPDDLNDHPWTNKNFVKAELVKDLDLIRKPSGYQLVAALSKLFLQMLPSTEPKIGKRIDSRWAQFGIMAAQYFAPVTYGSVFPSSLRDACGRIDEAISSFVYKKPGVDLADEEISNYQIIGDEAELIPVSTLSDWNTTAIIKFSEIIYTHEQFLINHPEATGHSITSKNRTKLQQNKTGEVQFTEKNIRFLHPINYWVKKHVGLIIILIAVLGFTLLGFKGWRIYNAYLPVKTDLKQIQELTNLVDASKNLNEITDQVRPLLTKTTTDIGNLQNEIQPLLWATPAFFWVPVYGEDISHVGDLVNYAYKVTLAANLTFGAATPIIDQVTQDEREIKISDVIESIKIVQLPLTTARAYLDEANASISEVNLSKISSKTKGLLDKVGPLVALFDDALTIAVELPSILGSSDDGPKTYIVLIQNSDELRATGGFITGVATLVIEDGKILTFKVEDSYSIDNPEQYYPPAPWQLERYMNAYHWVFRDSNWSPDFPTTAKWSEMFVATGRNHSVDGVIAVNQESLRFVLKGLGSIRVTGADQLISADNVIQYMRQEKNDVSLEDQNLHRKDFMANLTQAILQKLKSGNQIPWITLGKQMLQALEERHILINMDNPNISTVISKHQWDGALQRKEGDYLLVVNSNIGFSKVNAVINEKISYQVDLSNSENLTAILSVVNKNNATGYPPCSIDYAFGGIDSSTYDYASYINMCYLDYLRVYKSKNDVLIDSSPHEVPAAMLPWNEKIPAKVDYLLEENTESISGYGTLMVVPGNKSVETSFTFELPSEVVQISDDLRIYNLYIQKQAGTLAIPVEITILFPEGVQIIESSIEGTVIDNQLMIITTLREDVELAVTYKTP